MTQIFSTPVPLTPGKVASAPLQATAALTSSPVPAEVLRALGEQVAAATVNGTPVRIVGGGTKDWYGQAPAGEPLTTSAYRGVIAYDPAELVITARAGTPLAEIETLLAHHGQMLPFEPPHFGSTATLGGCIAAGLAGPRRATAGAPRDFVLGAVLMNGRGEILHFGGQVMKNVAGYDVSRLLAGSLGTLGLILEVSIKVLPVPVAEATLRFLATDTDAIRKLNEWGGMPLPISASAWCGGELALRLEGADAAVKAAKKNLGGDIVDAVEASRFWGGVREQTDRFFKRVDAGAALWRLSVPSTTEALPLAGQTLIEWGGAQRWWITDEPAQAVREISQAAGGHATLFRNGDKQSGVFTLPAAGVMAIQRRLKAVFDPASIFNRARMFPDF
jgi:glycolate oxidase FAD binding subunit